MKRRHRQSAIIFFLISAIIIAAGIWLFHFSGLSLSSTGQIISGSYSDSDDWYLVLVNSRHAVPKGWSLELTKLSNGESVDSRIYPDLQQMFDDARAEGVYPLVRAGYRTNEEQQRIMDDKIAAYKKEGYSDSKAKQLAEDAVAVPGTSEHELGLAVDINADLSKSENEKVYEWLAENAWEYGFIQRYPEHKADITGIEYEPWHYRYVGKEAAKDIYKKGICLEEYLK